MRSELAIAFEQDLLLTLADTPIVPGTIPKLSHFMNSSRLFSIRSMRTKLSQAALTLLGRKALGLRI